ncbi:MAG TPA: peptidase S8 [Cytophagales bacterium]|nr:peptidase S8 [Cytophagales bacterium]HAA20486.1 peptidase S8 [Cytophagales bacterium]HAP64119.1 peptidase S8 [Cytophagales bacterium]
MKTKVLKNAAYGVAMAALVFSSACQQVEEPQIITNGETDVIPTDGLGDVIPGQWIVKFKDSDMKPSRQGRTVFTSRQDKADYSEMARVNITAEIEDFLAEEGIARDKVGAIWTAAVTGFVAQLSDREAEQLRNNPMIEVVEPDIMVYPIQYTEDKDQQPAARGEAQTTPCGISNAGGPDTNGSAVGGAWAWVIDSGIDLDHPDLNVVTNSTYARSFVGGSANDCNGHGTHVAGTIGAINNSIGVVGMVAGAPVVPVRVFGCSGGSATSTIISGINHAASYDLAGDVANLSLGGYYGSGCGNNSTYRSALFSLDNQSLVAIAAGNDASNAALYQPACVNSSRIVTVASMTCGGSFSSFSNYNMNPVDYIATGSSVYSTWVGGGYRTISGTSMATPHVAGIMLSRNAKPRTSGSVSNRGESYPKAVR